MTEISIVIPVYNVDKYLKGCLDSILAQTFKDFEVICIDDGSTDKSLEILEEYKNADSRVTILNQQHQGAGTARNLGLEHAKGKYIQFLDSDDYFEPDMLEELHNHALKYNADLVVCSSKKVDEDGRVIECGNPLSPINLQIAPLEKVFNWKDFTEDIFIMFSVAPWNKLYLKELITKNNLKFQNISSCNDVFFGHVSRLYAERIVIFNKPLINYRQRAGNICFSRGNSTINIIHAALGIKKHLLQSGMYDKLKKAYLRAMRMHIRWETGYCNEEQYEMFLKGFKQLMPEDWKMFSSALKKDFITFDYLNRYIGEQKVMLWGASLFLKNILENRDKHNPNILGIIDKNSALWGKQFCGYNVFPPNILKSAGIDGILLTVYSNNEDLYEIIQEYLKYEFPDIKLLPNIFKEHEECE